MSCEPIKDRKVVEEILEALATRNQGFRDSLFFEFLFSTGLRVGDALAVKKKDIDFVQGILTIKIQKTYTRKTKDGKEKINRESDRRIGLNQSVLKKLDVYADKMEEDALLFPFKRQWAHKLMKWVTDYIGLDSSKYSMHTTRKTAAWFYYLQTDKDLVKTQKFLGHKDPKETEIYLKISDEEVNEDLVKIQWS